MPERTELGVPDNGTILHFRENDNASVLVMSVPVDDAEYGPCVDVVCKLWLGPRRMVEPIIDSNRYFAKWADNFTSVRAVGLLVSGCINHALGHLVTMEPVHA
jgi:hypothetical protein